MKYLNNLSENIESPSKINTYRTENEDNLNPIYNSPKRSIVKSIRKK